MAVREEGEEEVGPMEMGCFAKGDASTGMATVAMSNRERGGPL